MGITMLNNTCVKYLFHTLVKGVSNVHRASWVSAVRCKTRGRIEIITISAVLFN